MKWRWSLRLRFLLLLVVLLVAIFAAITTIIVSKSTATLKDSLVNESKSFSALSAQPIADAFATYQNSGTIRIDQEVESFTNLDHNISQVEVVDSSGSIQYMLNKGPAITISQSAAQSLNPSYIYSPSGDLTAIIQPSVDSFGIHRYNLVYGITYKAVNQSIRSIVSTILVLSIAILIVSLILGYLLISKLFLMPVARLSHVALLVSHGDLDRPIKLGRNDEIGDLAGAVDTMANSLKANIVKLKELDKLKNEFMMITSHNLRTPLTVINGYLDMLKPMQEEPELKAILNPIKVNVMRLGGFAEDMLTISTIEAGQNILNKQPTEIAPVINKIAEDFAMMANQKQIKFESHINTNAKVDLSPPHFHSALWNLLDNAYKFTKNEGKIELNAYDTTAGVEISIEDNGIGIASSELPMLFTKFHRGTSTLTYDYEGTGIGLYISKLIIRLHGGLIKVASTEGKGSKFTIYLPVVKTDPSPSGTSQPD